jgi:hypothetical protein
MTRALDLFRRLETGGVSAVEQLINDAVAEELFLDFKGSRDSGGAGALGVDDAKNMAKAISGFGNSEGGVLVWGVDARKKSGVETLGKAPLDDANGFRKRIETAISRLTVSVHPRIRNLEILEADGRRGYVATLIAPSAGGPLRAVAGELDNYYVRVGDSFKTAPHAVLAGMFGKPQTGTVWVQFFNYQVGVQSGSGAISFPFGLGVANGGATLLERPYVSASPRNAVTSSLLRLAPVKTGTVEIFESMTGAWQSLSTAGTVVVPGGVRDLCMVQFAVMSGVDEIQDDLHADVVVGVTGVAPKRFEVGCSRADINAAIAIARRGRLVDTGDLFQLKKLGEAVADQQ